MSKFKVGDKVVRNRKYRDRNWSRRNPGRPEGAVHTVTAVRLDSCIELDNNQYGWDANFFDLVVGSDDPETLPAPAPADAVNSPQHYQVLPGPGGNRGDCSQYDSRAVLRLLLRESAQVQTARREQG